MSVKKGIEMAQAVYANARRHGLDEKKGREIAIKAGEKAYKAAGGDSPYESTRAGLFGLNAAGRWRQEQRGKEGPGIHNPQGEMNAGRMPEGHVAYEHIRHPEGHD
jgi:hypothetical protein